MCESVPSICALFFFMERTLNIYMSQSSPVYIMQDEYKEIMFLKADRLEWRAAISTATGN